MCWTVMTALRTIILRSFWLEMLVCGMTRMGAEQWARRPYFDVWSLIQICFLPCLSGPTGPDATWQFLPTTRLPTRYIPLVTFQAAFIRLSTFAGKKLILGRRKRQHKRWKNLPQRPIRVDSRSQNEDTLAGFGPPIPFQTILNLKSNKCDRKTRLREADQALDIKNLTENFIKNNWQFGKWFMTNGKVSIKKFMPRRNRRGTQKERCVPPLG